MILYFYYFNSSSIKRDLLLRRLLEEEDRDQGQASGMQGYLGIFCHLILPVN